MKSKKKNSNLSNAPNVTKSYSTDVLNMFKLHVAVKYDDMIES